jgi:hypothetical protein
MAEDGRKNNGGHKTAGRKSKAEEYKLVEALDKHIDPSEAIEMLVNHVKGGSEKMLEKYLAYRFGMPKQMIESTVKKVKEEFDLSKLSDKDIEAYEEILNKAALNE